MDSKVLVVSRLGIRDYTDTRPWGIAGASVAATELFDVTGL